MVPTWVADMLYRASLKGMYVFKFGGIVQPPLTDDSGSILAAQDKPFSEALFHLHHIIPKYRRVLHVIGLTHDSG